MGKVSDFEWEHAQWKDGKIVPRVDGYQQYSAIPASVHLERGYCCNNGCVNCPYPKGCPSHDSFTEEMESSQNFTVGEIGDAIADRINDRINVRKADADRIIERMNKKVSAAFTKGLIVGAIIAIISIIAGYNF